MSVVITKSASLTNRDAVPAVLNNPQTGVGKSVCVVGQIAANSGDSIGSTYKFVQIPSNARLSSVKILNTGVTSAAMNLGLYQTTQNGGAAVSASLFASALSIATAVVEPVDVTRQSGSITPAMLEMMVWQVLGLAQDPMCEYDVVGTLTAAATAAGNVGCEVSYIE